MRRNLRPCWHAGLGLLAFLLSASASAQCSADLSDRFNVASFQFGATEMLSFDDGSGPALYAAGGFTVIGGVSCNHIAKWNGTSWSPLGTGIPGTVSALASYDDGTGAKLYAAGAFTSAGGVPAVNIARWNGTSWTAAATAMTGPPPLGAILSATINALTVGDLGSGPRLFATGRFGSIDGVSATSVASHDGTTWQPLGAGLTTAYPYPSGSRLRVFDAGTGPQLYVLGTFALAGTTLAANIARWDGSNWSALGVGLVGGTSNGYAAALTVWNRPAGPVLAVGADLAISIGGFTGGLALWDGNQWSSGNAAGRGVAGAAVFDARNGSALYTVGHLSVTWPHNGGGAGVSALFQKFDGTNWSTPTGQGLLGAYTRALVTHDDGTGLKVYAGGEQIMAGDVVTPHVAAWNGAHWNALGPSLTASIYALAAGDIGNGPRLYAAGTDDSEPAANPPILASPVRAWDGATWSALGPGLNGWIEALGVQDLGAGPALYAAGTFTSDGITTLNGIARWTGAGWAAVGGGIGTSTTVTNQVDSLATFDDGTGVALYAGGTFTSVGGVNASNIARWNGTAWAPLGSGVTAASGTTAVSSLAVFDDGTGLALFAGGPFTSAGGTPAAGLAKWNGFTWSPVGGGVALAGGAASVNALRVHDDGSGPALYVGGSFTAAGGIPANSIARWNGQTWSTFGTGVTLAGGETATVFAFTEATLGGRRSLFAGGTFAFADGRPSLGIAQLTPHLPALSLNQSGGTGSGVFIQASNLVPGREYFNVFSADLCGLPGSGPYFGLCANDPGALIAQVLLPTGTLPFHFAAANTAITFGPFFVPGGITVDALCLDYTAAQLGCVGGVVRYTTQ